MPKIQLKLTGLFVVVVVVLWDEEAMEGDTEEGGNEGQGAVPFLRSDGNNLAERVCTPPIDGQKDSCQYITRIAIDLFPYRYLFSAESYFRSKTRPL